METGSWSLSSSSSSVQPSLELGRETDDQHGNKKRALTVNQLHELELQALIFKYIEAALPVPHHLLIPIYQSFSNSPSHYPSCMGVNPMCLGGEKGTEQEPWRCRRTDGKKWRCAKEALPRQKYCERHVHRGRHRSRKLPTELPKRGLPLSPT